MNRHTRDDLKNHLLFFLLLLFPFLLLFLERAFANLINLATLEPLPLPLGLLPFLPPFLLLGLCTLLLLLFNILFFFAITAQYVILDSVKAVPQTIIDSQT